MGVIFYLNYTKALQNLDEKLLDAMRLCSYTLECEEFRFDFAKKGKLQTYKLYKDGGAPRSYFPIPGSEKNLLVISLDSRHYALKKTQIEKKFLVEFLVSLGVVALVSLLFAFYALWPLQKALRLTEEFVKDILHDFNTPLSILRLNASMLQQKHPDDKKIKRIEGAVESVLSLQKNLRSYLSGHALQKERFDLRESVAEQIALLEKNYPHVTFENDVPKTPLECNKSACERILENLLSNAAKYNDKNGFVKVWLQDTKLLIQDNGKGIYNPKKIFERFYKEQERGIGIGLHIVKKLCEEMEIPIEVQSEVAKGTTFALDLKKVIFHG